MNTYIELFNDSVSRRWPSVVHRALRKLSERMPDRRVLADIAQDETAGVRLEGILRLDLLEPMVGLQWFSGGNWAWHEVYAGVVLRPLPCVALAVSLHADSEEIPF